MPIYKSESLESLRQRIDIVEVISSHVDLKKAGATYKGLCPFHDEKTPSFVVQKGDKHYHCFGCGAHGDAIQFLMTYSKMSFQDSIESLAQRFKVHLELAEESEENKGPSKALLKEALNHASRIYHFFLLHTPEGHEALNYLYSRGLDLNFIRRFMIGYAPKQSGMFRQIMHQKGCRDEIMVEAGLISLGGSGGYRDFFSDRITFPIYHSTGYVIGFSSRKFKEETFGGKYVNTPETLLFKKSKTLYGLNYCRRRIAKERVAIVVEGQIDALRLIDAGLDITVAGQGTAFGESHVKELLALGVNIVYLAMDGDTAGREAMCKIGDMIQKEGIEAKVVPLPDGADPDSYLASHGIEAFLKLVENSEDYLTFLVAHHSKNSDLRSPAGKNELVQNLIRQIRSWDHPLMVHESLRKLAFLTQVPEDVVGVGHEHLPNIYIKKSASVGFQSFDPDRILESDFIRWLLLEDERFLETASLNLQPIDLKITPCRQIYQTFLQKYQEENVKPDLLSLAIDVDDPEAKLVLSDLLQKKVNREKSKELFIETLKRVLDRNWMQRCEELRVKIQSGQYHDDEVNELAKQFSDLRKTPPKVDEGNL